MKKAYAQFLVSITVSVILMLGYLFGAKYYTGFDNKLRDYLFINRGAIPTTGNVVVIDIDERSLKELGQWPWERNKFAQVLQNLTEMGVGVIGLDIVFAEPDSTSPSKVLKEIGITNIEAPDYDAILGQTIANSPTIVGYVFAVEEDVIKEKSAPPNVQAVFIEKGKPQDIEFLIEPYRPIVNVPQIQENAYSSGFFNTIPDESGVIRSVPFFMKYNGAVMPSLAFEMLRAAYGVKKVFINYDEYGVSSVKLGDTEIPTDRLGRIFVNFRGGPKTFEYISAADIYNNKVDKSKIEGKFAIIGTSAAGLLDLRSMPYDAVYPGVEVHANVVDNVLAGDFLYSPAWAEGANLLFILGLTLTSFAILYFSGAVFSFFYIGATLAGVLYFNNYMLFTQGVVLNLFFPMVAIVVAFMSAIIVNYFFETRQKEMIKGKLSKKVSPQVMEDLLKNPDSGILEGKEKEITIFFSDIRGFTTLSEAMGSPKALIDLLNRYMTPMVEIIISHEGTVDKFIGDAIMAYWNAPNNVDGHCDKAVSASIKQIRELKNLNATLLAEGKPTIDIGIGLNTGTSTVGEMGSAGRADYTIIGDPVNLASRLEGLNKPYGAHTIISEFTYAGLADPSKYLTRDLDLVRVKGKTEPVRIFEVLGFTEENLKTKEEMDRYHDALILYRNSEFTKALELFKELESAHGDKLYHVYIERCEEFIEHPPVDFDGVYTFTTK